MKKIIKIVEKGIGIIPIINPLTYLIKLSLIDLKTIFIPFPLNLKMVICECEKLFNIYVDSMMYVCYRIICVSPAKEIHFTCSKYNNIFWRCLIG
jgi:hypothetical protein